MYLPNSERMLTGTSMDLAETKFWRKQFEKDTRRAAYLPAGVYQEGNPVALYHFNFGEELSNKLQALSQGAAARLHVILLSALSIQQYKYHGTQHPVTGTPVFSKNLQKGNLLNGLLPIVADVNAEYTAVEVLRRTGASVKEAAQHQNYPTDLLPKILELTAEDGYFPLFDISLSISSMQDAELVASVPHRLQLVIEDQKQPLSATIHYPNGTWNDETLHHFAKHFMHILGQICDSKDKTVAEISLLDQEEHQDLRSKLGAASQQWPHNTLTGAITAFAESTPGHPALKDEGEQISYAQMEERANQLANYLLDKGYAKGTPIALVMERRVQTIVSILGIMKAGYTYVPFNPNLPFERLADMVEDTKTPLLLGDKANVHLLNKLQWEQGGVATICCIDTQNIHEQEETFFNELMDRKLWEYVGEDASDDIEGGGWKSSFTGGNLGREEMDEYGDNAFKKLQPLLHKDMRVLEIGCASGITMFRIAPLVGHYHGTDLSRVIIEKNKTIAQERGLDHMTFSACAAHEIDQIKEGNFDLIIINSVIQSFHGYNYLRKVIGQCTDLMADKGHLFIGDVMDQDLKGQLIADLKDFAAQNIGKGYQTKTDFSSELFVARDYFDDLTRQMPGLQGVSFSGKIGTIKNELTEYRYDTLFSIDKKAAASKQPCKRIQEDARAIQSFGSEAPVQAPSAEDIAYIIYTSGSTGRPKGVMVRHANVTNTIYGQNQFCDIRPEHHFMQFASLSFDASIMEIFMALLAGSTLCIISEKDKNNRDGFLNFINDNKIQATLLPPSFLSLFQPEEVAVISRLITGGEAANPAFVEAHAPVGDFYNAYGPTEIAICASMWRLPKGGQLREGIVPIGSALPNTQLYILNEAMQEVPQGHKGQLYVGGAGVAAGYLNLPEQTAEKFIDNPFGADRIYATGDQVRLMPDGELEYLGRVDDQVKIRGYRIEPGEVEAVLQAQPLVRDGIVIAKAKENGDKYLAAYYQGEADDRDAILDALGLHLPDYMVPAVLIPLDKFPLTASGKIDRRKLPEPSFADTGSGANYEAPETEMQKQLMDIWQEVLGEGNFGIKDNFFQIGGHSLKAIRMTFLIRQNLGRDLEVRQLFERPTIADLAELLEAQQPSLKEDLLPVAKAESYALSPAQQRMWVLQQLAGKSSSYHITSSLEVKGAIDAEALRKAFGMLQERHESLRTHFAENAEGEIRQYISDLDSLPAVFSYEDHSSIPLTEDAVQDKVTAHSSAPFALDQAPLIRTLLLKLAENHYVLSYTLHHIISDGWSQQVFVKELFEAYQYHLGGQETNWEPLQVQYKDYAAWINKQLSGEEYEAHRKFWVEGFSGEIPTLDLPADHPRPVVKQLEGGLLRKELSAASTAALKATCQEQGATLFMGLLSTVHALFYHYTGQEDQVIGTPVAGRDHAHLASQIGFYVNTLALRNQVEGDKSFLQLLSSVKNNSLRAFQHQVYPFDYLINELKIERDTSRSPLFDVMVALQNTGQGEEEMIIDQGGVDLQHYAAGSPSSEFDLTFHFVERDDKLLLLLEYDKAIYDAASMQVLSDRLEMLLDAITSNPAQAIASLNWCGAEEIITSAAPDLQVPGLRSLLAQAPVWESDRMAATDGSEVITYRQLHEQANQLAHFLITQQGIKAGDRIAILQERSVHTLISLLAIIRAGASYVPVDADYPDQRVQLIISDAQAVVVLTDSKNSNRTEIPTLVVVDILPQISSQPVSNPEVEEGAKEAYLLYTSGTTGTPKGVSVSQQAVASYVAAFAENFDINENDKVIQQASLSFDTAVEEIFPTLIKGAELIIMPEGGRNTEALAQMIWQVGATVLSTTPLVLNELNKQATDIEGLRLIISGGDVLQPSHIDQLIGIVDIYNTYGPTETTVCASWQKIQTAEDCGYIGKACAGKEIIICSEAGLQQPWGAIGELIITGAGLADGYWQQPELTHKQFITLPDGRRAYRSGDLASMTANGRIRFKGRKDKQVKVRGYRIETAEVEQNIAQTDGVKAAVAGTANHPVSDEKVLLAWVVLEAGTEMTAIRQQLSAKLPAYMVPSQLISIDQVPRTVQGKTDYSKLPQPNWGEQDEWVAPASGLETDIAQVWEEVLELEAISARSHFFELGGNSLKATRILSRLRAKLDAEIELRDLFTHPTIADMARLIADRSGDDSQNTMTADKPRTVVI